MIWRALFSNKALILEYYMYFYKLIQIKIVMFKFLIIVLLFSLGLTSANAQTGCIDGSGKIHTSYKNAAQGYNANPSYAPSSGCSYIPTGGGCKIGGASGFFLGNQGQESCPIDDYVWVLATLLGGLGFYFIRKKNSNFAIS